MYNLMARDTNISHLLCNQDKHNVMLYIVNSIHTQPVSNYNNVEQVPYLSRQSAFLQCRCRIQLHEAFRPPYCFLIKYIVTRPFLREELWYKLSQGVSGLMCFFSGELIWGLNFVALSLSLS